MLGFQKELHECVQHIQDPVALRQHVTAMYRSNVNVDLPTSEMDANVIHEYQRHKVCAPQQMFRELVHTNLIYPCAIVSELGLGELARFMSGVIAHSTFYQASRGAQSRLVRGGNCSIPNSLGIS